MNARAAIRALAVAVAALVAALPCAAAKLALLVGVSQYPGLAPELQLKAPANDVRLMREVLRPWGFDATHVQVLADGVDGAGLPTHANIVAALGALAARARPGDMVYLHFSGHGSLQQVAGPAGGRVWQPVFLPRDVGAWNGSKGPVVPNALSDVDLRRLVDRINDTGAAVFAVFDACHSARLVRGAVPGTDATLLRVRHVPAATIGDADGAPPEVRPAWLHGGADEPAGPRGHAVYFYAAQSVELAATRPLADHGEPAWHGLFSWHIAQALAEGQPMSYRQLGQHVLSRFDLLPDSVATPLFGGDGLDQAVFGQRTILLRQWPLQREHGVLSLPAGALNGLAEGALFSVLADPAAPATNDALRPPDGTIAFVRAGAVDALRTRLEPVAWRGLPALAAAALPPGTWARLMVNPPSFALSVAVERAGCADDCLANRVLAQLRRDGVPGVDVRWAGPADVPDVRLHATPAGLRMLLPGAAGPGDGSWGVGVPAGVDAAMALDVMTQQAAAALHRVARTRNLLRLAAARAARPPSRELRLTVEWRGAAGSGPAVAMSPDQLVTLGPLDQVRVRARNDGGDALELALFWLGADQSVTQLYPADARASGQLKAGESIAPEGWKVDPGSEGTERLLAIALPVAARQEASSFRFLQQSPLGRVRGAVDPSLQSLVDACFGDYAARGETTPALPADRLALTLFTFHIRR